nr:MAG TPA: hypothetical protein [Caudoviricetes sp.]
MSALHPKYVKAIINHIATPSKVFSYINHLIKIIFAKG